MNTQDTYAYLFVSRNKDNKHIPDFKERRWTFLRADNKERITAKFQQFISEGLPGEMCRLYRSVNPRNTAQIRKNLLLHLIQHEDTNLCKLESLSTSIAMKSDCALTKKWMFDFDTKDEELLNNVLFQLKDIFSEIDDIVVAHPTPNGYAIIVPRGFDSRKILEQYQDVMTLKRDGMLLLSWNTNKEQSI